MAGKFICECKAVKNSEITKAIRANGARNLIDIQNITKASTGCGKCKPAVLSILDEALAKIARQGLQLRLDF